jgi:2-(1,2-epoxy-1,2-dihydrophenyl)acetyl-CoA isomerase
VLAVRNAPKPVVGAVHGAVAGLGVSLALACDLLIASSDAYLLLAFSRIAVMPDAGALSFLAERIGLARAAELAMLAEKLPAERAREWGLVNAVHPPEELADAAFALADRLAAGPTVALASIKKTLVTVAQDRLAQQLDLEAERQQVHGRTHDYAEGRSAFLEKRTARYLGR